MSLPPLPKPTPPPPLPPFQVDPFVDPPDAVPFLVPGTQATAAYPSSDEWMRAPGCPNTGTDCRITITFQAVSSTIPVAVHTGEGEPAPPLVVRAVRKGACSVCHLTWDILKSPPGPNDFPLPVAPPIVTLPP